MVDFKGSRTRISVGLVMGMRRVTPELEDRVADWLGEGRIAPNPWFVPPWGSGVFRPSDQRGGGPRRGVTLCLSRLHENRGKLKSP